jgi:glycosyltransferase involved in cell wall biosynthesis
VISILLPAHDEERAIARAVASVHASAGPLGEPYEVIVVDDASTDRTAERARAAGALVGAWRTGRSRARATRAPGRRAGTPSCSWTPTP